MNGSEAGFCRGGIRLQRRLEAARVVQAGLGALKSRVRGPATSDDGDQNARRIHGRREGGVGGSLKMVVVRR